ncbi:MAG: RelA/SpoT family protein, partial [Bacilli bacterium]
EDKCLYYLDQKKYFELVELVDTKKATREALVANMIKEIDSLLVSNNIIVNIQGRSKHLYSIYKKMVYKNKTFDEIYDLQAIRIICKDALDCYAILGIIHSSYRPIPGRFKDYIAMQKPNMYQSLHTTIIGIEKSVFEIQIRTQDMDDIAERGFAAHWRYKEGSGKISNKAIEEQLHWFRDFVSLSDQGEDLKAKEYMNTLQRDIFEANVHVLTPKGKVVSLPKDACIIDFAYKIHSKVAESMVGALVNNHFVPFNYKLKTGDVVEIKTQNNSTGPSIGWLDLVKTSNARQRIKHFLKMKDEVFNKELMEKGKQVLHKAIKDKGFDEKKYQNTKTQDKALKQYKLPSIDDLYKAIAEKSIDIIEVINCLYDVKPVFSMPKFIKRDQPTKKNKMVDNGVIVEGIDDIAIELSKCCNPIPGDEIIGYIASGKAIKVHTKDCLNVAHLNKKAFIDVEWDPSILQGKHYFVDIIVHVFDRVYMLSDIVTALSQINVMVASMDSKIDDLEADIFLNIRIENGSQLQQVYANLKKIESVISVTRANK